MPRDVEVKSNPQVLTTRVSPAYVNGPDQVTSISSEGLVLARGRGDLRLSDGHKPTPYQGWRVSVGHTPCEYSKSSTLRYLTYPPLKWNETDQVTTVTGQKGFDSLLLYQMGVTPANYGPEWDEDLVAGAHNRILNKLLNPDINVAVSLGEISESAELMVNSLTSLIELFTAVKKRKWKEIGKQFGVVPTKRPTVSTSLAEAWLAYQLGWKPLISDLYNAHSAILESLNRDPSIRVEARTSRNQPFPSVYTVYKLQGSEERFVRMGITCKITDANLAFLSSIGLANPLSLGWELTPLSFLFDYFLQVGNFLSALGAEQGLDFLHGYRTRGVISSGHAWDFYSHTSYLALGYSGEPWGWDVNIFSSVREVLADFPKPQFRLGTGLSNPTRQSIVEALVYLRLQDPTIRPDLGKYWSPISQPVAHFSPGNNLSLPF